jgi:predicted O-methyltransferase YrrM
VSQLLDIPNSVLVDVFATNTVITADGDRIPLQENITAEAANAAYRLVREAAPTRVLEVGMANAVFSLAVLTALAETHGASAELVSIDPFQSSDWRGVGKLNVERAGFSGMHTVLEEPDYLALPRLLEERREFDFAYIDGWHNFEYVLLDFFYIDRMLPIGGIVGFNDCDWKSVMAVTNFLRRFRDYSQVASALPRRYGNRSPRAELLGRVLEKAKPGLSDHPLLGPLRGRRREDLYFRKETDWEPEHGFWSSLDRPAALDTLIRSVVGRLAGDRGR